MLPAEDARRPETSAILLWMDDRLPPKSRFKNVLPAWDAVLVTELPVSSVNPATLTQILSGVGLAGLAGRSNTQLTPEQAQKLSPEAVQQLATHAQNSNPSVVESISTFYAQHTTLIKTLGGAAMTVALAKVAERQRQA
jgi:hypothetical protein